MFFPLVIIGLIFGGLLTLLCLVFAIISLAKERYRNALIWGGGFVVALFISILSVVKLVHFAVDTIKGNRDWTELDNTIDRAERENDPGSEYRKEERQQFIDTLKAYVNEKYEDEVPAGFYANHKAVQIGPEVIRVPFLYPFRIDYNLEKYTGDIIMEGSDSIFVKNVSAMAFDQNFVIIRIDNSDSPEALRAKHAEIEYVLFDLRTRNYEEAANKEQLMDFAGRIGYTGPLELRSLASDYIGWCDDPDPAGL